MKSFISIGTSIALLTSSVAFGESLASYQRKILPTYAPASSLARALKIRQTLGTENLRIADLDLRKLLKIGSVSNHRFYSSLILKDIMQAGVRAAYRAERMDAQIPYDPSWSVSEHRQIMALKSRNTCVKSMIQSRMVEGKPDGITAILADLDALLLSKAKDPASKIVNKESNKLPVIESLNNYLTGTRDILGPVTDIEVVDGMIHSVVFGKGEQKLPISINTMITWRMGEDDIFLSTQDCLVSYLNDQKGILQKRYEQINGNPRAYMQFKANYEAYLSKRAQIKASSKKALAAGASKELVKAEQNELYLMLQKEDEAAQFAAQLNFFLEGKRFEKVEDERVFIRTRLAAIAETVPFLESRVKTARLINKKLKKLPMAQVNVLLDMFIQLKGQDLPTMQDTSKLAQAFSVAPAKEQVDQLRLDADYMYYRVLGNQLTDLEQYLASERSNQAAKEQDLAEIRKR